MGRSPINGNTASAGPLRRYFRKGVAATAILFAAFAFQGCSMLIQYSVVDPYTPSGKAPGMSTPDQVMELAAYSPQSAADAILTMMLSHEDRLMVKLGLALIKLPDLSDGITPKDVRALKEIYILAESAGLQERETLAQIADENGKPYQFSGNLQGLFWYARKKGVQPGILLDIRPDLFLDYAWDSLPRRLKTPRQVLNYMTSNFSYRLSRFGADGRRAFFKKKYGDCTEFTLMAGYLIGKQDRKVYVLLTRPTTMYGHASLIYEDEKGLWLMDVSRAVLARVIKKVDSDKGLSSLDRRVWREVGGFDRIFGPKKNVSELVEVYEEKRGAKVPYRVVDYQLYEMYVEEHGHEAGEWWNF